MTSSLSVAHATIHLADSTQKTNNFLVPNATFIVELVSVLLIMAFLGKYVVPRLTKALGERQAIIDKQMTDAEETAKQLAEAKSSYEQALNEARAEAAQIRESARAEAQRSLEELRAAAQEESARIVARGEEQLARQRSSIVRELRAEIGTLAVELSEKIVEQRLADDAQVRATVDAFIAGLDSAASAGAAGSPS
ncbi:F0F1 ATP synthase subunit B [Jatrophihabitans sp.]|uniref:F0F1 ATP synthase subunit B n=1 Tax=Jatrophihabitans sp. TaxID=1932789 RepID=UPI0030C71FE4|nr:atpF [Jatrophihabitans sp.]